MNTWVLTFWLAGTQVQVKFYGRYAVGDAIHYSEQLRVTLNPRIRFTLKRIFARVDIQDGVKDVA